MGIAVSIEPRVKDVSVTDGEIIVHLSDGRIVSAPRAWSWRLSDATPAQRANFEILGDGQGIHWPEIDEDLSAQGFLTGTPARRPKK